MNSYLIDTNCLLRFLLRDLPVQAQSIKKIFEEAKRGEISLYIPLLTFVEADFSLSQIYHFEKAKIVDKLFSLAKLPFLEVEKYKILLEALLLYSHSNIGFVDALFVTEARITGKELLTFDKKLKKLKL